LRQVLESLDHRERPHSEATSLTSMPDLELPDDVF
jgi:hypothetical protein